MGEGTFGQQVNTELGARAALILEEEAERLLDRAQALEQSASRLLAERADLENEGLERVARFEEQRRRVIRAQERMHTAEIKGDGDLLALADAFLHEEERKRWIWRQAESLWARSRRYEDLARDRRARAEALRRQAEGLLAQAELLRVSRADASRWRASA